jgi:hypothetical protein
MLNVCMAFRSFDCFFFLLGWSWSWRWWTCISQRVVTIALGILFYNPCGHLTSVLRSPSDVMLVVKIMVNCVYVLYSQV